MKSTMILRAFTDPEVDPAHAPKNISMKSTHFTKAGHASKSVVVKPVVVIIETTWKDA